MPDDDNTTGTIARGGHRADPGEAPATLKLADLNAMGQDDFVARLADIFERSPWVPRQAFAARPFASREALWRALLGALHDVSTARKLALIRAHPDLAGKAARAGEMASASVAEQAGVGLDRLSDAQFERFDSLNLAYRQRFDFPFIIAVRNHTRDSILAAFESRLKQDRATEMEAAVGQIAEIARFRIIDRVQG